MSFTKIYLEGTSTFIEKILEFAREELGDRCNVINLNPEIKELK